MTITAIANFPMAAIAASLVLAACGGGGGDSAAAPAASEPCKHPLFQRACDWDRA